MRERRCNGRVGLVTSEVCADTFITRKVAFSETNSSLDEEESDTTTTTTTTAAQNQQFPREYSQKNRQLQRHSADSSGYSSSSSVEIISPKTETTNNKYQRRTATESYPSGYSSSSSDDIVIRNTGTSNNTSINRKFMGNKTTPKDKLEGIFYNIDTMSLVKADSRRRWSLMENFDSNGRHDPVSYVVRSDCDKEEAKIYETMSSLHTIDQFNESSSERIIRSNHCVTPRPFSSFVHSTSAGFGSLAASASSFSFRSSSSPPPRVSTASSHAAATTTTTTTTTIQQQTDGNEPNTTSVSCYTFGKKVSLAAATQRVPADTTMSSTTSAPFPSIFGSTTRLPLYTFGEVPSLFAACESVTASATSCTTVRTSDQLAVTSDDTTISLNECTAFSIQNLTNQKIPRKRKEYSCRAFPSAAATANKDIGSRNESFRCSETRNVEISRSRPVNVIYHATISNLIKKVDFRTKSSKIQKRRPQIVKARDLKSKHNNAIKESNMLQNEMSLEDQVTMWYSNTQNVEASKRFLQLKKERSNRQKKAAVVLDLFSGIGSGTVVLKNLGIALDAVISVEHDPIAQLVNMVNHYPKNEDDDTSTRYKYIPSFELLDVDAILNEFGPIDLIIGGPPCVDFSAVNANRRGVEGFQGGYILEFANLIKVIKVHEKQKGNPVFFLCENVPISFDDGLNIIEENFNTTGISVDAKYFSHCKRNRMYFTNIPPESIDWEMYEHFSVNTNFLGNDFMHPAEANLSTKDKWKKTLKANTCMASKSRIDDNRMVKVRHLKGDLYEAETFDAHDRALMLDYPCDYVWSPVVKVFQKGADKLKVGKNWENVQASTPWVNKQKYFYDAEAYVKHLLGNGYSIPVVEHFLSPLKEIFAELEYDGYVSWNTKYKEHVCRRANNGM